MTPSHFNEECEAVTTFDCGCYVGNDGGTYCCPRHYELVGLLHTKKRNVDPDWHCPVEPD